MTKVPRPVSGISSVIRPILDRANCHFKVNPADLQREAATLEGQIRNLNMLFDSMLTKVNSTKNYWLGDASDHYRSEFANKKEDMEEAFNRMREHVNDLNQIASTYTGVENVNVEMARQLSDDVIL